MLLITPTVIVMGDSLLLPPKRLCPWGLLAITGDSRPLGRGRGLCTCTCQGVQSFGPRKQPGAPSLQGTRVPWALWWEKLQPHMVPRSCLEEVMHPQNWAGPARAPGGAHLATGTGPACRCPPHTSWSLTLDQWLGGCQADGDWNGELGVPTPNAW